MSAKEAYRREQSRQTQIITDAINKAITDTATQFETPMMNAVAGALVAAQGHMLASVPKAHRKAMQSAMAKQLPRAIASAKGSASIAQTVTIGGKTH
ncbi:hypothetical protein PhaeoP23_01795 [Phaeobacter piscinae]|uniref:Uncharacterized protein n=1 Tax=Phaeobacter piscinae TaxID=1580596 RepID=A0ABN5DEZ6_9RHOB|nr:hypothetical protein [Phaeobacter piscinae]ATG35937.1 hypothetical protein PhaeoP36_01795 [Phaeobacter piscinae]AUQ86458.1 hypothetical protein PhaeoP42_01796 [Phaeobacter piscinae]AUR24341.1 hypothetical protein PhaeoP23_01795 [Phaeobacter piscinae]